MERNSAVQGNGKITNIRFEFNTAPQANYQETKNLAFASREFLDDGDAEVNDCGKEVTKEEQQQDDDSKTSTSAFQRGRKRKKSKPDPNQGTLLLDTT
ncbi:hypothetical protein [Paenibacillus tyrfis]|uniref:hypothetical protein n=1 Tax=Paenibacillus tyrfis TaxID=1501230 RepID=UPI00209E6853|nr:hypothetical protein [Paenibacillus tyrfis]MCP1311599.1 hypothetical protein [Paenibacillus tyrfis]